MIWNGWLIYNSNYESFNNAKFVNDEISGDKIIMSNVGKNIIIWKFKEVIKGNMNCYRMKIRQRFLNPIKNGVKRHEYRLSTPERKLIKIGDVLILIKS